MGYDVACQAEALAHLRAKNLEYTAPPPCALVSVWSNQSPKCHACGSSWCTIDTSSYLQWR
jgi:hypothetical protein